MLICRYFALQIMHLHHEQMREESMAHRAHHTNGQKRTQRDMQIKDDAVSNAFHSRSLPRNM